MSAARSSRRSSIYCSSTSRAASSSPPSSGSWEERMRAIRIIFRRELSSNLRSPFSWALAAGYLLVTAILFKAFAFGTDKAPLSALVLERYFMFGGLVAIIAGVVLSFRLIAEERQTHSMVLLSTSPVRDSEIVVGKFLAAFVFLALLLAMS